MSARPVRILHMVPDMQRNGGIQNTLMHLLRNLDRQRFHIDIAVQTPQPSDFDQEIRDLGSQVLPCYPRSHPLVFARRFRQLLRKHGPYDVVHSHVAHYSGYVLLLAQLYGVPMRIAHSRNDETVKWREAPPYKQAYVAAMRRLLRQTATHGLAVSADAAAYLFGAAWQDNPRYHVALNGFDFAPFRQQVDRRALREQMGIPQEAFVIGNVGRLAPQKNHHFLLDIASYLIPQMPNAQFVLVGDGPLRSQLEAIIADRGLTQQVRLLGVREDVPQLMLGVFDLFLFPSLHEGFGNVLIEAQAAGLPCLLTETLPKEADAIPELMRRLSLEQGSVAWADALRTLREQSPTMSQEAALARLERSPYTIDAAVERLQALYAQAR